MSMEQLNKSNIHVSGVSSREWPMTFDTSKILKNVVGIQLTGHKISCDHIPTFLGGVKSQFKLKVADQDEVTIEWPYRNVQHSEKANTEHNYSRVLELLLNCSHAKSVNFHVYFSPLDLRTVIGASQPFELTFNDETCAHRMGFEVGTFASDPPTESEKKRWPGFADAPMNHVLQSPGRVEVSRDQYLDVYVKEAKNAQHVSRLYLNDDGNDSIINMAQASPSVNLDSTENVQLRSINISLYLKDRRPCPPGVPFALTFTVYYKAMHLKSQGQMGII